MLAWYDRHRRALSWRAAPGVTPDPYRVWLSEIMLQQTTVKTVGPYYERFLARWPTVGALARAPLDDVLRLWAGLGYYARARNLHACARVVVDEYAGRFPNQPTMLLKLPGVGSYTAAAIAAIAFGEPATPVDGNVNRVIARLFAVETPPPASKATIQRLADGLRPPDRPGDFAQALMDLGATICTPTRPTCAACPWSDVCAAHARGDQDSFPRKVQRANGRLRRGAAFFVRREDGAVLVRTRAARGLLGGMTELPTSDWTHDFDEQKALLDINALMAASIDRGTTATREIRRLDRKTGEGGILVGSADHDAGVNGRRRKMPQAIAWRRLPGVVTHVFTHFPLELVVYVATVTAGLPPPPGARYVAFGALDAEALPTVMRKVIAHATKRWDPHA